MQQAAAATTPAPSKRARLYELMADLTDEDGALTDLVDIGWPFLGGVTDDGDR